MAVIFIFHFYVNLTFKTKKLAETDKQKLHIGYTNVSNLIMFHIFSLTVENFTYHNAPEKYLRMFFSVFHAEHFQNI